MFAPVPRKNFSVIKGDVLSILMGYNAGTPPARVDLSDYTCELGLSWTDDSGCRTTSRVVALTGDAGGTITGQTGTEDFPAGGQVAYAIRLTSEATGPQTILMGDLKVEFSPLS